MVNVIFVLISPYGWYAIVFVRLIKEVQTISPKNNFLIKRNFFIKKKYKRKLYTTNNKFCQTNVWN